MDAQQTIAGSRVAATFAACRKEKRAAFVPFLVAGDPHLDRTEELALALVEGGADLIELGVPFSDPIADGPTNQRASFRSLQAGTTLDGILEVVSRVRTRCATPIVLFSYFNPIGHRGVESFAVAAAQAGVDGVLCVDLPPDEAQELYVPALRSNNIDAVFLLAPTSTRTRIAAAAGAGSGFLYYVSRAGTTGTRTELPQALRSQVRSLRRKVKLPVAVGFGISTPEQVAAVAEFADGVVVGSALVKLVEAHPNAPDLARLVGDRAAELSAPLRKPKRRSLFGRLAR